MVLICISLIISDSERLFMSIDHLYVLLGKVSIQVLCRFFNRIVCLALCMCVCMLSCMSSLLTLDINPLLGTYIIGKYVLPFGGLSFLSLMVSFAVQTLFSLM